MEVKYSNGEVDSGEGNIERLIERLLRRYPDAVFCTRSGMECGYPEVVYSTRPGAVWDFEDSVLVWSCEEDSINDDGSKAIAVILEV